MLEPRPRKLLDQVRDVVQVKHYSHSTEKTYIYLICRFILFHNRRHPNEMGIPEINWRGLEVHEEDGITFQLRFTAPSPAA